jgi:hypothetical protein
MVAAVTAMNPKTVVTMLRSVPAATRDPTSEIAEIALVADINGVCRSGGTRVMT